MAARFIADAMLGKLARWLRIIGCDTLYDTSWSDARLIQVARAQSRLILTRDTSLAQRRGAQFLLITSDMLEEQLRQIRSSVPGFALDAPRCPTCNTQLVSISRQDAWGNVPLYVFADNNAFSYCSGCDKYYWPGTQWSSITQVLERALLPIDEQQDCQYNQSRTR